MDETQLLKKENEELRNKVIELEERLKKYTAPTRHKKYYEENKEDILKKQKEIVLLKKMAAKELGYLYEILVYDNKGNKVDFNV
jgi:hypothetical protein